MKLALALVLALACGSLYAQTRVERTEEKPKETKKEAKPPHQYHKAPPAPPQRALERPKNPPARTAAPERPTSPPSQAELMQRQLDEQRRLQLQQQERMQRPVPSNPPQTRTAEDKRAGDKRTGSVRCSAHPVCKGGGYGSCRGVEQSYGAASLSSSRQDIVRQCMRANSPDTCNCAAQCGGVAQCSIF